MMEYEEMTYEEKAKETFRRMRIDPTQEAIMFLATTLELEYELGGRDELKKQVEEMTDE